MSRHKSQIPRMKPASSCGNLARFGSRNNLSVKPHQEGPAKSPVDGILDRKSMIDAPVPVTHRRMCGQYQLTKPPWATDDSLNPFERQTNFEKPKRAVSSHNVQRLMPAELVFYRAESPPLSMDNSYEEPNHQSQYDAESIYRTEVRSSVRPRTPTMSEGIQTDFPLRDVSPQRPINGQYLYAGPKSTVSNIDKRSIVHPKELKRENQKNHLTYRIHPKDHHEKPVMDFITEPINYRSEEEMQERIDYWLKKNVELQKNNRHNNGRNDRSPDSKRPQFRNQITFTPRSNRTKATNGFQPNTPSNPTSPQTIEAVIVYSDSGSEKDNVVSSRSMDSRSPKLKSLCKIQADLSPRTRSPIGNVEPENNDTDGSAVCDVCGLLIRSAYKISSSGICCHKECFACFWCKKRLSLENYKINGNKLCCPIHFRLIGN